jgi:hypothetical protein
VSLIAYGRSTLVTSEKYIGLDVHQATMSVAVVDAGGKLVMESILETKASTILQFIAGLRGNLSVTLEEGTWAAWLYDVLKPHVTHLVVFSGTRAGYRNNLIGHCRSSWGVSRGARALVRLSGRSPARTPIMQNEANK